jgi:hypothetical protein
MTTLEPGTPQHPRTPRAAAGRRRTCRCSNVVFGPSPLCKSGDAEDWQPAATTIAKAEKLGADAIGKCVMCPVRAECLELEMRTATFNPRNQRIRAGLVGGVLRQMHTRWLAGESVLDLLWPAPVEELTLVVVPVADGNPAVMLQA